MKPLRRMRMTFFMTCPRVLVGSTSVPISLVAKGIAPQGLRQRFSGVDRSCGFVEQNVQKGRQARGARLCIQGCRVRSNVV